mmetsp:Transcript_14022/g.34722  ORF Transcript_14022/g.34722 Transcript_14022/m.34722 type:complete len:757 (-) Transcript_14022:735-3005(-)|eukprot:CAMPEP_0178991390 /NCGR_PEP_ID=MMETSP0795-20121207/5499_1 /TAXON_ID=88552 /ORGANISM="Amoebophrya sp., Strain Ameob2" /LENGTH=756 /DNA_ID=CAMNT_0020683089 /DNA_START=426 /DNA_END=2696 /DNA_ORIENTATION=-
MQQQTHSRGGRGDDFFDFTNTFALLIGVLLLLLGAKGALRSWRSTLKCRILMRAFGFFDLKERIEKEQAASASATGSARGQQQHAGEQDDEDDEARRSLLVPSPRTSQGQMTVAQETQNRRRDPDSLSSAGTTGETKRDNSSSNGILPAQLHVTDRRSSAASKKNGNPQHDDNYDYFPPPVTEEEKARCIESILCYGEVHMSEMMADFEQTPSHLFRGMWLVSCLFFLVVRFQDMNYVNRELLDMSADYRTGDFSFVYSPPIIAVKYALDVIRGFILIAGLIFSVFIPRARRKDYWVYDLPGDVTDAEIDVLLRNRNVGFLSLDVWHGFAAGIAVATGGIQLLVLLMDIWARCAIGTDPYSWIAQRRQALGVLPPAVAPDANGGAHHRQPFELFDPSRQCNGPDTTTPATAFNPWGHWVPQDFGDFVKCFPLVPGEKHWWFGLGMRSLLMVLYFYTVWSTASKFDTVHVGTSSYYRGLRAEHGIVKIAAYETAFMAVSVWFAPQQLNDYLVWAEIWSLWVVMMLFLAYYYCWLLYATACSFMDCVLDYKYPDCVLAKKFDVYVENEAQLKEQLRIVHQTRRMNWVAREGNKSFATLLERPPDELELRDVLLYREHPSMMLGDLPPSISQEQQLAGGAAAGADFHSATSGTGAARGGTRSLYSRAGSNLERLASITEADSGAQQVESTTRRDLWRENPWLDYATEQALRSREVLASPRLGGSARPTNAGVGGGSGSPRSASTIIRDSKAKLIKLAPG